MLLIWPLAFALGLVFVQWWKTIILLIAAFAIVPIAARYVPAAMSEHHIAGIRADIERRIAAGSSDDAALRRLLAHLS